MRSMSRRLPAALTSMVVLAGLMALPAPAALAGFTPCVVTNARTLATTPDLATAIANAAPGDTLKIQSVCEGGVTITKRLTLVGVPGTDAPRIDGKGIQRTLTIAAGKTVTIRGLGIIGGFIDGDRTTGAGGGILNLGTLTLKNVNVEDNLAAYGAGIANRGTLTLVGSSRVGNNSATQGGGIDSSGTLILKGSTLVQANGASTGGGGVALARAVVGDPAPVLELHDAATITANSASFGAGIWSSGGIVRLDGTSSVAGNVANNGGGGVWMEGGKVTLSGRAAIKGNVAGFGGAIGTAETRLSKILLRDRSVIKANHGGPAAIYLIGQLTMSGSAAIRAHDEPSTLAIVLIDRAANTLAFLHMSGDSRITGNAAQSNGAALVTLVCLSGTRPELKGTKGRVIGNTPKNVINFQNTIC